MSSVSPARFFLRLIVLVSISMHAMPARGENVTATIADVAPTKQINHFIAQGWKQDGIQGAEGCSERTFVRRLYLDLAGRVPTSAEVETYLADGRHDKRVHLIDLLLGSEDHVQHFADIFDTLLMGRVDEGKYAERVEHQWRAYLEKLFRENRPWNEFVAEVLLARPENQGGRGSVWFLYERNDKHQVIAESVAPAFFGIRVECAQCHDHMIADEIKQEHYWGLVAFFNRGKNEKSKNGPRVAESAIGGFSEFADLGGDSSPNRLRFFAAEEVNEERPEKDETQEDAEDLYVSARLDGDPRVPKFSRREKFVKEVVHGHPLISRALVNRVWAMMMGRGIVHPYDEMDSVHDPSHPELLDWLAEDFAASGFDIRRLVRSIAMSDAYQLDSRQPEGVGDPATFAWYLERPLTAEQMARSIQLVVLGSFRNDASVVGLFRQQFLEVLPDENIVTIGNALFFSNNRSFDDFIASSTEPDHFVARSLALSSHEERAEFLFQTAFGRAADSDEQDAVVEHLSKRTDSLENAMRQVLWAALASAEFRFNH